ncbi:hypothetical protein HYU11_03315 [Candidatus Woesearchaeota archaeon]|nr:hypothetical protein [Candidatus Woesearchaeota archaeon]
MAASNFGNAIDFFDKIGIFDVVIPFLFVFTIVFAILEKTRIFGVEKFPGGEEYTRKNLNAMTAFSIAFFVIASANLVRVINEVAGNMILLLIGSVFFLMLVGSFHQETKEGFFLEKGFTRNAFIGIMFTGLVVIFLHAIRTKDGKTWLDQIFEWIRDFGVNDAVPSIVLALVMIGLILYITQSPKAPEGQAGK